MRAALLCAATLAIFLGVDMVGIRLIIQPLFLADAGPIFLAEPRLTPALLFYPLYAAGLVAFVSLPALRRGDGALRAALVGAGFGAVAYGTYELTNFATLTAWTLRMTAVDMLWGAALSGFSAAAGLGLARRF